MQEGRSLEIRRNERPGVKEGRHSLLAAATNQCEEEWSHLPVPGVGVL